LKSSIWGNQLPHLLQSISKFGNNAKWAVTVTVLHLAAAFILWNIRTAQADTLLSNVTTVAKIRLIDYAATITMD
jgi:hypothetical protein